MKGPGEQMARIATIVTALYLPVAAFTFEPADRSLFGTALIDLRVAAVIAAVLGIVAAVGHNHHLRLAWLAGLTVCSLGRAVTLLMLGSSDLSRKRELLGVYAWSLHWVLGVLAVVMLTATSVLSRTSGREPAWDG